MNAERPSGEFFELALLVELGKCGTLLQKMHTVATHSSGNPPANWQEFPAMGYQKIRASGGRGANSACVRAEVRQQA
jgi:hypothetical protein